MESDLGKLFIGGISWDTDEERLKEYFGNYGEVVEAVIMRDRATGRARGFGFVVFADPLIAERVTRDKHMIDGRTVEAKKAVPREDQHLLNKGPTSIPSSPSPGRTRKIFVGGLASNVTESDFKKYFDQFGTITDVVVMYDHNTQRPRGFGFITYDSEDAVDRVLLRTFHDLNGKMVEVKRAVPKELSPGPSRSPVIGYNSNLGGNRVNNLNFLTSYAPSYGMASIEGYRVRSDGGLVGPIATGRGGSSPFNGFVNGMGLNLDRGLGSHFNSSTNLINTLGYGRVANSSLYNGNSERFISPIGYQGENMRSESGLSPNFRSSWGPMSLGAFGNMGLNWNLSPIQSPQGGEAASSYQTGNNGFGGGDIAFGLGGEGNGRKSPANFVGMISSFSGSSGNFEDGYNELGSGYAGSDWLPSNPEENASGSFSYGIGNIGSDVRRINSESFSGNYSTTGRESNRGIAA